jgi:hypothetical protein
MADEVPMKAEAAMAAERNEIFMAMSVKEKMRRLF